MNRSSLTRRLLTGAIGITVGVASALAFAAPASAHRPYVTGEAVCDQQTGEWVVTWTVTNSEDDLEGKLIDVAMEPAAVFTTIVVGATVPESDEGSLQEVQRIANGTATEAALWVKVEWVRGDRHIIEDDEKTVPLGDDCAPPSPSPSPSPEPPDQELGDVDLDTDCESLFLTITNDTDEDVTFEVVLSEGESQDVTVAAGGSEEVTFPVLVGLVIDLHVDGESVLVDGPIEVTEEALVEAGCEDDGEGGGLPETGAPTTLIVAGAGALLLLGAGLFMMARRRRVTFTA